MANVLMVDDCEKTISSVSVYLSVFGHSVSCFRGRSWLTKLDLKEFDILLTTSHQDHEGEDVFEAIGRAKAANPKLRVILSCDRMASPAHRCAAVAMSLGADAFLPKPITPDGLISAVGTSA